MSRILACAAAAVLVAGPALAQEPARPAPAAGAAMGGQPRTREPPSPPVKMAVEGEQAPPRFKGGTAIPETKLAIKNTLRDPVTCRLAIRGAPGSQTLTLAAGQEFSQQFPVTVTDIALLCPQVRRAAYSPLLLGSRYVFVRLETGPQLVEVAPPDPK